MSGAVAVFININMPCKARVNSGCDVITPLKHQFSPTNFFFLLLVITLQSLLRRFASVSLILSPKAITMTNSLSHDACGSHFISSVCVTECWNYLSRCIFLTCSMNHLYYWQTGLRVYRLRAACGCSFSAVKVVHSFTFNVIHSESYCDCGACNVHSNFCGLPGSKRLYASCVLLYTVLLEKKCF